MTESPSISLTTDVADLPGVGKNRAAALRDLGLRCVADLLRHLPLRYERQLPDQTIEEAGNALGAEHGSEANVAVRGEVLSCRMARGRRSRFEAIITDETGTMQLTWFNAPWMRDRLHPGMHIAASGKVRRFGDYLQLINPKWHLLNDDEDAEPAKADRGGEERLLPVYPASERLTPGIISSILEGILDEAVALLDDHLHDDYRQKRALLPLAEAYRMMHHPTDQQEIDQARRRLAFDDLLLLQLAVMLKRAHRQHALSAPALEHNEAIDQHIKARFPFTLTDAQQGVIDDIVGDITTTNPMNRLLQGDVGSGKTVVALYAMLMAAASRHQAAFMAPTELLAEQHLASITEMLEGSNVRIELLTGSLTAAQRRTIVEDVATGAVDILIGTHALLTESVEFKSLAVAVIDEQHRFGVHQRAVLRSKAADPSSCPHTLVMTATPIPRTLSLTVFGDLDTSTIRTLPPGRQPIITKHVTQAQAGEVYQYLNTRLAAGDQAYIVVPVIDESEAGLKDVNSHLQYLREGPLRDHNLAAMHGRMKRDERDAIMQQFRAGDVRALIATTVIEVGVDVPNATIMIVEHADRFGLAQLHQLRGRVGRGTAQSLCVLVADPVTDDGRARIDAISQSGDGFVIAEKDLEIRGPGELFGARQSGLAPFLVADLLRDMDLLRLARRDAIDWIRANPDLTGDRDALLRRRVLKAHGKALGLGDVA